MGFMHVDTAHLRAGANTSYQAADHAYEGSAKLSRASVPTGIFGDFDHADDFHTAVTGAHGRHVEALNSHYEQLGVLGDKAHSAAADFRAMDDHNKSGLDALRDGTGTTM